MNKGKNIHLLADLGQHSAEYTIAQALLYKNFPDCSLVCSSPNAQKGYVVPAAVFMKMVIESFSPDCIHICHITLRAEDPPVYIAARFAEGWILAPDNGLLPLLLENEEAVYYKLEVPAALSDAFSQVYLPAAKLLSESSGNNSPYPIKENPRKVRFITPTLQGNAMRLGVLCNDIAGNAIFNLKKDEFYKLCAGRAFRFRLPTVEHEISRIHAHMDEVPMGSPVAFFGPGDYLQIAFNGGSAKQYLGLSEQKTILLEFNPTLSL